MTVVAFFCGIGDSIWRLTEEAAGEGREANSSRTNSECDKCHVWLYSEGPC